MKMTNFSGIEKKWQKRWESKKAFNVKENVKGKKKYYVLEQYPYPSGSGLHMGHAFIYTIGDIYARLKRMQGFNVLYPMGFDSFGLPAENAAIAAKSHPKKFTDDAIKNFISHFKSFGNSYDWTRMLKSHDPEFYKWDQWIFLKMFEKGLAYRKKAPVNWCRKCGTVLANEQVVNGKCWRHEDCDVDVKLLEQWFLKTTDYAEELLSGLDKLDGWPEQIKKLQRNWIGKSKGTEVDFEVSGNGQVWKIFTTRVDTLFGVTFLVVSAQHPELMGLVTDKQKKLVSDFLKKVRSTKEEDMADLEKEGVFTGSYATHPLTGKKVPIWIGNFVVADYGSGMVMADAHDERDVEFAKKYNIPLKIVIEPVTGVIQENPEHRRSIVALVKNPKNGKILSINWGERFGGNLLVGGGLEKREDPIECAKREITEEAGYYDLKFIEKSETIHHNYFAHSKNKARRIDAIGLYFELKSEKRKDVKLERDEAGKFKVEWMSEKEAENKINDGLHKYVFNKFIRNKIFTGYGVLTNSEGFDGLESGEAIEHITIALEKNGKGRKKIAYRLKDWLISRQRFWGCPIPIIYCDKCGIVPVKEKDLPVKLPENIKFTSKKNPLADYGKFVKVKCGKCGANARRETDTMDTFMDSSWYFLRYTDPRNRKKIFDNKKVDYWMPIDMYIGGKEHAVMHDIYFRFCTMFLADLGLLKSREPAVALFNQGFIYGEDGRKMSKSLGNVIVPKDAAKKYGVDAIRLFLVSSASPDKDLNWSEKGVEGSLRFILRVMDFATTFKKSSRSQKGKERKLSRLAESKLNRTIRDYTSDLEGLRYNLAVIKLRELFGILEEGCDRKSLHAFLAMLSPICPHISEEMHSDIFGLHRKCISVARFPKYDVKKIDDKLEEAYERVGKTIEDVNGIKKILNIDRPKVHIYTIPNEYSLYYDNREKIKVASGAIIVEVYPNNKKDIHDPESKSKKAKPGRPGIYVE